MTHNIYIYIYGKKYFLNFIRNKQSYICRIGTKLNAERLNVYIKTINNQDLFYLFLLFFVKYVINK